MKINDLKDLEKLIKLARRLGVEAIEADNVKLNLGPMPNAQKLPVATYTSAPEADIKVPLFNGPEAFNDVKQAVADVIKTDELTEEQLLMWSSGNEQQ